MTDQRGNHLDGTAVPFPIGDWLTPKSDSQILIVGADDVTSTNRSELLAREIALSDWRHSREKNSDGAPTNSPARVEFITGVSRSLPYDSNRFDLLVCHFLSARIRITKETLQELARVLHPEGHLLIIDNVVPGSRLRGNKARQLRTAGDYINAWMRLRNSQHKLYLSEDAWIGLLTDAQFSIQQMSTLVKIEDFGTWVDCYSPDREDRIRLQAMLVQAPEKALGFLTPERSGDRIAFRLTELIILATMSKDVG
jgi:SAM-dependent methyltransferase